MNFLADIKNLAFTTTSHPTDMQSIDVDDESHSMESSAYLSDGKNLARNKRASPVVQRTIPQQSTLEQRYIDLLEKRIASLEQSELQKARKLVGILACFGPPSLFESGSSCGAQYRARLSIYPHVQSTHDLKVVIKT